MAPAVRTGERLVDRKSSGPKPLLTDNKKLFFQQFEGALPNYKVFPQVAFHLARAHRTPVADVFTRLEPLAPVAKAAAIKIQARQLRAAAVDENIKRRLAGRDPSHDGLVLPRLVESASSVPSISPVVENPEAIVQIPTRDKRTPRAYCVGSDSRC